MPEREDYEAAVELVREAVHGAPTASWNVELGGGGDLMLSRYTREHVELITFDEVDQQWEWGCYERAAYYAGDCLPVDFHAENGPADLALYLGERERRIEPPLLFVATCDEIFGGYGIMATGWTKEAAQEALYRVYAEESANWNDDGKVPCQSFEELESRWAVFTRCVQIGKGYFSDGQAVAQ